MKADPANAQWQRDRAVVAEQRGAAFKMRGQNEKAREAFRTALAAYEAMLSRRPGDYQARLFSVVPLSHLSELEPKLARQHLETALAILRDLKTAGRLDAQREGWIATLENNLAELDKPAAAKAPAPAEASSSAGQGTAAARKPLSAASAGLTDRLPSQEGSPRTGKATRKPPRAPNAPPSENSGPLKAPQDSN